MKTEELKARLITRIEAADENELKQLEILLNYLEKEKGDWFNELSPELKRALKKSLDQSEPKELLPYKKLLRETEAKYELKGDLDFENPPQEIKDLLEIAQKQVANGQTKTNEEVQELIKEKYGFRIK